MYVAVGYRCWGLRAGTEEGEGRRGEAHSSTVAASLAVLVLVLVLLPCRLVLLRLASQHVVCSVLTLPCQASKVASPYFALPRPTLPWLPGIASRHFASLRSSWTLSAKARVLKVDYFIADKVPAGWG
jgi:hypothetical protein